MGHDIALLPGDGVGPELIGATVPVLQTVSDTCGFEFETTTYDWGAKRLLSKGSVMPDDALDRLESHDSILFVAMGDPDAENATVSQNGHHRIRKGFDLFINLRRARLFEGVDSPLSGYEDGDVDILWYRENSEGEYLDAGGHVTRGGETELAVQNAVFTRKGVERIVRAAFEAATEREGKLTSVTKSNALPYGPGFWDEVVSEIAIEYPDVQLEELFVDAANMYLITQPEEFDVVVGSNLFSDILTEAAAAVTGGLALAPSGNINPNNEYPNMFEPVHGSAPDIAGNGTANPLATVLSAAMMLEDLGEDNAADLLRDAVSEQLSDDDAPQTPDMVGTASTTEVTADIRQRI